MTTRYHQLGELYDRAHEHDSKRLDQAVALASALLRDLIASLGIPEALHSGPASPGRRRPAVEVCWVPDDDRAPINPEVPSTALTSAVATEDGENYRFGLVVRVYSRKGNVPHAVVFRVRMRHKLNDTFEVRLWSGAEPHMYSAAGRHAEPLSTFSEAVFSTLGDYFTAVVCDERKKKPVGFDLLAEPS